MDCGRKPGTAWLAVLTALIMCMTAGSALAVSPEQYRRALEKNVEDYSGASTWRKVAGQLCADEAGVRDGDGSFVITDEAGNDYLTTNAARISIGGDVRGGDIVKLTVRVTPTDGLTREYEYQAFSLSEIAFESLLGSAAYSDMSAYLFLYDIYPYAMWSSYSEFGDYSRGMQTALGGVNYAIDADSSSDERSIRLSVEVLGEAGAGDEAMALDNLYANYAFESICSLVYELNVCKSTCVTLLSSDDYEGEPGELLGDMRSCAQEYYALGAQNYEKLYSLTQLLSPEFERMLCAIDELEGGAGSALDELESAVDAMCAALRTMY